MALLKALQSFFMVLDGLFQLLYVLCPSLSEGGLCLSVPLLAFFGGSINLFAFTSQLGGTRHCIASKQV